MPAIVIPVMSVHTIQRKYHCELLQRTLEWLTQFRNTGETRLVTLYQLNALFEEQTKSKGFQYDAYLKKWQTAPKTTIDNFVRRTNSFSSYIQGVLSCTGIKQTTKHTRSSSCVLSFWTRCVPVSMPQSLWHQAEQLLLQRAPRSHSSVTVVVNGDGKLSIVIGNASGSMWSMFFAVLRDDS